MEQYRKWAEPVMKKIREKMEWVSKKNQDKIPYQTDENGDYDDRSDLSREWNTDDGLNWWTNGFWGGIMWLLYQDTKKEHYAQIAQNLEDKLTRCFEDFYGLHHDVGFMFQPTAVINWRLTKNKNSIKTALHAANL